MCSADLEQYGKLLKELQNDFTKINGKYPKDMKEAIFMIMNYKQTHSNQPAHIYNDSEGLKFSQNGRSPPPTTSKISATTLEWLDISPGSAPNRRTEGTTPRPR